MKSTTITLTSSFILFFQKSFYELPDGQKSIHLYSNYSRGE
jgi:hypothetical protein